MDDIRYSELLFLQEVATGKADPFNPFDQTAAARVTIPAGLYTDMAASLIEDLFVRFHDDIVQLIVPKLRGELGRSLSGYNPGHVPSGIWDNPRQAVRWLLN